MLTVSFLVAISCAYAGEGTWSKPVQEEQPAAPQAADAKGNDAVPSDAVYATASGKKYHRKECRFAKNATPMTREEAQAKSLTPCKVCKPDAGDTEAAPADKPDKPKTPKAAKSGKAKAPTTQDATAK
jgi:hypothetical protein